MEEARVPLAAHTVRRPARLLRIASDERLVALVRAGDDDAFEALYDRHHQALLAFCRHMLGAREEAEDALQHTFLAAYRDLVGSTKPIELRPWLYAIARNRCHSLLRARRDHLTLAATEPATDGLTVVVEQREQVRELLADLARLPEDQRAALLLAELGRLDHTSVAAVLGCRRDKVKALVYQARSSLAASHDARTASCESIRAELAVATGGALRRGPLRRHLRACAGCRAFKAEVASQRQRFALLLPVVPGLALKAGALPASFAAGGAATGAWAGTGIGGELFSTGAAKLVVALALAGTAAGGGTAAIKLAERDGGTQPRPAAGAPAPPFAATPAASTQAVAPHAAAPRRSKADARSAPPERVRRSAPQEGVGTVERPARPHVPRRLTRPAAPIVVDPPAATVAPTVPTQPPDGSTTPAPPPPAAAEPAPADGGSPPGGPPGNSGNAPGHGSGGPPGHSQGSGAPGNSGNAPGHGSGGPPGHSR